MWFPRPVCEQIEAVAKFRYIDRELCEQYNKRKAANELRLLTGYEWIARDGSASRAGFKTLTVAYRDAYYALIRDTVAPTRRQLRVVSTRKAA
jgi:hypothetical protein